MTTVSTDTHTVRISIPYKPSLITSILENKKPLLITAATLVIGLSMGMPIGGFIYDRITNAGLTSCACPKEPLSSWGITLPG
ncbi:hypothetical protein RHABOEDO_001730 [Candidatus Rhabdochlamydia oedothoracis]|uniref:Major facilitator superfamily (MFS) profile domain-containing protein n=1 Tax=Candidatus Rhabdochlamydia oedothoracis TaxID=2720720 RepID=A0ABX8V2F8_9BACT|nr:MULTISPECIES: hypothetical protein [Rhabdochlamydia]KAG6558740.1 hypothetical protein RHOW815_001263 [Candidatus Rhabdochlamydia sp. W815]MCL6756748.1 hypothetical protein [Candidatus Rhabdochlamydia oedothoracis]QYF49398.1 hypothetical protein RHABOEDO_001730 [Candidatus Rhabdochlamydia oedothoracis]